MSFTGKDAEAVYIIVSIKLHIGKYMGSGQYVCDILYYNTGTWCNCDDETINNYSGYQDNIYDILSNDNEQKKGKLLLWMDQIGLCQCYK